MVYGCWTTNLLLPPDHRTTVPESGGSALWRGETLPLSITIMPANHSGLFWKGSSNYASRAATRTFSELTDTGLTVWVTVSVLLSMCNMSRLDFPPNWEKITYSSVLWEQSKLRPWSHCRNLVACLLELEVGRIVMILSLFHAFFLLHILNSCHLEGPIS